MSSPRKTAAAFFFLALFLSTGEIPAAPRLPREITGRDDAPIVLVPAGEFLMGSPERTGLDDERPRRRVFLNAFYIDRYPVTVALYRRFCAETGREMPPAPPWGWHDEHPVVNVSWQEAAAYAAHHGKRLPTEAEWEKACRAGTNTIFSFGDDESSTGEFAWTSNKSGGRTRPVTAGRPNPLGIHEMHGNTWEWCADWYDASYYRAGPRRNPSGPDSGVGRVLRGGSWRNIPGLCRSASRFRAHPGTGYHDVGFRCASTAPTTIEDTPREAPGPAEDEQPVEGIPLTRERVFTREASPGESIPEDPCPQVVEIVDPRPGMIQAQDGSEMILVPAGTFRMGSPADAGQEEERPSRRVHLDSYYIGRHPVTVAQYRVFCAETGREMPPSPPWGWHDDHPVINVTWHDAVAYVEHHGLRLPTEAEWERACRAGTETLFSFGEDASRLAEYAWFGEEAGTTRPVGGKKPNNLGIHDMHGNAWEWCADWFCGNYYRQGPAENPPGPESGSWKILRGGSFSSPADFCRSAFRAWADPSSGGNNPFGFRGAMDAGPARD